MSYGQYGAPHQHGGYAPPTQGYPGGYGGYGNSGNPVGFTSPPPSYSGPPPGVDPQLWNWFNAVDADRSGAISASELERALVNGDWTPFDIDTVKLLMSIFDTDRSGTISFQEFTSLWKYIQDWQGVFRHFDADRSGTIDSNEFRNALVQFGLSQELLDLVQRKYGSQGTVVRGRPGSAPAITFDRFVRACVVVKQLSEAFNKLDTDRDGWIQINNEQFMRTVLTLP